MRRSTTAVLLSALVLPGAGHLFLKYYGRGAAAIAISLACLWVIADSVMQQASTVLGQLEVEGGTLDPAHISDLVTQASNSSGSAVGTLATVVLAGCWLVGMVDAYRLGKQQDERIS